MVLAFKGEGGDRERNRKPKERGTIIELFIRSYGFPFVVGLSAGAVNYAGLWYTAINIGRARRPAFLSILSFYIRMGIVGVVFYAMIMDGRLERLISCLAGFLAIRFAAAHYAGPGENRIKVSGGHYDNKP